jgi:vitamin B12 transporter
MDFQKLRHSTLIPFFALGMGYQIQGLQTPFLQTAPSAEEVPADIVDERQDIHVVDSLRSLPGVVLQGSEVSTRPGSLFLRGSDVDHTLFIWNDLRSDNFTAPTGATDPFGFGTEFSNRIRVLKGPQSLLYGTQALGGVVLIDNDPDLESSVSVAGGSLNSAKGVGELRARGSRWQMGLGGSLFNTTGVSSYDAAIPRGLDGKLETDGRQKGSATLILSYDLPSEDQLQFLLNTLQDKTSDDVPPMDDPDAESTQRMTQWKLRYKANWSDTSESSFLLTGQDSDRENKNQSDAFGADYYLDQAKGHRQIFLNRNSFRLWQSLWQVGLEYSQEQGDFFSSSNTDPTSSFHAATNDESLYLVNDWNFKNSDLSWGVRGSCQEGKSCLGVYQLSYQWHWVEAQRSAFAILSSGLKRPTMYQLYSPKYGDPDLQAETSQAYEVGLIQRWGPVQKLKVSVFENRFSQLIDYDFVAQKSKNLNKAKTQGFEVSHQYDQVFWDQQISFAQVYAKDEESGNYLLRRPVYQAAWNLGYQVIETFRLSNEVLYVGPREDINASSQRVDMPGVTLWNVALLYRTPWAQLFVRVNNVANTFYEDVYGYLTPGRFFWLGAKTNF